jgi:hypothetical protein
VYLGALVVVAGGAVLLVGWRLRHLKPFVVLLGIDRELLPPPATLGERRRPSGGRTDAPGDQAKVVDAMIDVAEVDDPPRRLLLGSDAYTRVHAALADRLAAFEGQKGVAYSTDVDDFHPAAT